MRVLEERPEVCIVENHGVIKTIPNTEYHKLRLLQYENNRINYTFQESVTVAETPTPQVFNCTYGGDTIHIKHDDAQQVCRAIRRHGQGYGIDDFREIFGIVWARKHKTLLVEEFIKKLDMSRIKIIHRKKIVDGTEKDATDIVVDGVFMVDERGTAHVKTTFQHWKHLCIVFNGTLPRYRLPVKGYCYVDIDQKAMEVITKVMFLMFPNFDDYTFMSQLPDFVKRKIESNR